MKYFLLVVAFSFLASCKIENDVSKPNTSTNNNPPNILLIIADDMGVDATPGYAVGNTKPSMPQLSALAKQGITYENAWAYPICAPTRATIITGKYGIETNVLNATNLSTLDTNETSLFQLIEYSNPGIFSFGVFGKWHLSSDVTHPYWLGVGTFAGIQNGAVQDYNNWQFTRNQVTSTSTAYCTTAITNEAIDWINQQEQPWFCWLAYNAPHNPLHLPEAYLHNQGLLPSDQNSIDQTPLPYYMAMIESMDYEIGRLIRNIPATELENTIIIFIGDNGTARNVVQAPYAGTQAKGSLYQGGLHVPLIIAGKGVERKGQQESSLVHSIDLFATIAALTESPTAAPNSYDITPSFALTNSSNLRNHLYAEVKTFGDTDGCAIRNERYKLIIYDNGREEMYDLIEDPYEKKDLLIGILNQEEQTNKNALEKQVEKIRG